MYLLHSIMQYTQSLINHDENDRSRSYQNKSMFHQFKFKVFIFSVLWPTSTLVNN